MPFAILLVGLILVTTAVQDTQDDLFRLLKGDFLSANSFIPWLVGFIVVWSVGFIKPLRPISNGFLVLIAIALILSNRGFFAKFTQQTGIAK